jgi:hypothetical protein
VEMGVVFPAFCVQNGIWRAVCGVGAVDMHRLCFRISTYSMCMVMGGGAAAMPVARWGWCGPSVRELSHASAVREVTGHTSRCVGGRTVLLPALSPCFPTSICVVSACMCSGGNLTRWVLWGGVLTWWWGSFFLRFVSKMGLGALCVELVPQICTVHVFQYPHAQCVWTWVVGLARCLWRAWEGVDCVCGGSLTPALCGRSQGPHVDMLKAVMDDCLR